MNNATLLGKAIKEKRLSLNLRMDDVARDAGITRPTLWAIEKGTENYSVASLFKVMEVLDMSLVAESNNSKKASRKRASRMNTVLDKKINRFLIMCVEQYAHAVNKSSGEVYQEMSQKSLFEEMSNDYKDLHGMSTEYLNDYINMMLTGTSNIKSKNYEVK